MRSGALAASRAGPRPFPYAFPFMFGNPTGSFFSLYLVFSVPALIVLLWRIWRPTRIR